MSSSMPASRCQTDSPRPSDRTPPALGNAQKQSCGACMGKSNSQSSQRRREEDAATAGRKPCVKHRRRTGGQEYQ